jgi:uncharacterized membrane protein
MPRPAMPVRADGKKPEEPSLATAFQSAVSRYRSQAAWILVLLLGWASVWVIVELLVASSGSAPGRPIWLLLHLAYFWGTAYWEVALLRRALGAFDKAPRSLPGGFLDHRAAISCLVLKMLLLPAIIVGTVLLLAPGLYCMARFGWAFFFVAERQTAPGEALGLSSRGTRGRRGHLMLLCLILVLFNMLGAALLGLGLIVTVPLSILICAHVFRAMSSCSAGEVQGPPQAPPSLHYS